MAEPLNEPSPSGGLTPVQWLICVIASIGFAFDIYELLMLPIIVRPALLEFGIPAALPNGQPNPVFAMWVGRLFYIPAIAGGIFGLLGGYLTDRLGRRRVLTWSILLYAFSAFFAGFSTGPWMLLVLRCTTFVGVCVEFVAAVAWLAELFADPKRRERVLGYTQAFSSVGGLLVAGAYFLAVKFHDSLPAIAIPGFLTGVFGSIDPAHRHEAWRYTLMSGIIPAIPLILIRPFLPESPVWAQKKAAGTLRRPSILELFAPAYLRTTVVTTIIFACSYGAAFGAIQHLPRIVPGLPDVQAEVREKAGPRPAADAPRPERVAWSAAARPVEEAAVASYQTWQEIGGLVGRLLLAVLAVRIVSRRGLLWVFQVPGLFIVPAVFAFVALKNQTLFEVFGVKVTTLGVGIFLAAITVVAQFSFWGNYLPRVYPVHLRGTGESFAANIGGRMIGTCFAWVTANLAVQPFVPGDTPPVKLAYTAAAVALFVFAAGFLASFWLPEPPPKDLEHE